tara:strand:- start:6749 stop:7381 length:633 start_codon:yes stop_codon:yes gene_type:complete
MGVYEVTEKFEEALCKYTGAPYAVAVDNCSNSLFMALMYEKVKGTSVSIPERTYPSVPCQIIHAGAYVKFSRMDGEHLIGAYQLKPTKIWDSALYFSHNMYKKGTHMCLSFSGPYKTLKLIKGGAILTDDYEAYLWFKRARFSGRREVSYHDDNFDMLGWNFYMMPEVSSRGILLMSQFYDLEGNPIKNDPITMKYPNLSKFDIYKTKKD